MIICAASPCNMGGMAPPAYSSTSGLENTTMKSSTPTPPPPPPHQCGTFGFWLEYGSSWFFHMIGVVKARGVLGLILQQRKCLQTSSNVFKRLRWCRDYEAALRL